jgi:hypothetical protein
MRALDVEEVLEDPEISVWLRTALLTALNRDPVDAAADAAKLLKVLDRRLSEILTQELKSESADLMPGARSAAA